MKIQKNLKNNQFRGMARGFSLFEMVIVMGIIGVILGGAIYSMRNIGNAAKIGAVSADFTSFGSNLDMYKINGKQYPTKPQGLEALMTKPRSSPVPKYWAQTLSDESKLIDSWGSKYQYHYPGTKERTRPEIISAGPDQQFGTDDDLSNQD